MTHTYRLRERDSHRGYGIRGHRKSRRRLSIELLETRRMLAADLLYVGDNVSNSIQQYDATTGAFVGTLVAGGNAGLQGPRGMVVVGDNLLVVNQNVNTEFNGEILRFHRQTGTPQSDLVASTNSNTPFAPRGLVVRDNVAYVADFEGSGTPRIARFNATTGAFLGNLVPTGFAPEFRPRGLVFGPDGGLYVSVFSEALFGTADPSGYILRIDTATGATRIVARNDGDGQIEAGEAADLHNPEGLVFHPDGTAIYVTSNRTNVTSSIDENTRIVVIDAATGAQLRSIVLDPNTNKSTSRIFAQALAFGPDGELYIPTAHATFDTGPFGGVFNTVTGGVLKYDPATNATSAFITPSLADPTLEFPFYLTFGKTNPATLAYQASSPTPVAPVLTAVETTSLNYARGDSPTIVSKTLTVGDADSTTLTGATIRFTAGYRPGQDVLSLGGPASAIQQSWNPSTGTLALSGSASLAKYQGALRCILYKNTSANPTLGQRTVEFRANDGGLSSNATTRNITVAASSSSASLTSVSTPPLAASSVPVGNFPSRPVSDAVTVAPSQAIAAIPVTITTPRTRQAESEEVATISDQSTQPARSTQPSQSTDAGASVVTRPGVPDESTDGKEEEVSLDSGIRLLQEINRISSDSL